MNHILYTFSVLMPCMIAEEALQNRNRAFTAITDQRHGFAFLKWRRVWPKQKMK